MDIRELLAFARKNNASDLHLSSGHPPTLRVHGQMVPLRVGAISAEEMRYMILSVMTEKQRDEYTKELEIDFALHFSEETRYRVNAFHNLHGPAAVMREIPVRVKTIEELKLPRILERLTKLSKGLILVTGPTGSGKSTTLAAMVHHINHNQARHIITIEDPIEFIHRSNKSLINQREVGTHTESFSRALRSALREDPDVILVGELRDLETISLALTAAETGHLVLATLHTSSAATTIDRLIDVFPSHDKEMVRAMLASSIEAVISQLLFRTTDGKGRVAAHEVLISNTAIRNLIRDNKIPQIHSLLQVGSKIGMCTMKDSLNKYLDQGLIYKDEARAALNLDREEEDPEASATRSSGF